MFDKSDPGAALHRDAPGGIPLSRPQGQAVPRGGNCALSLAGFALAAAAAGGAWAYADYRAWRRLGEGGLPANVRGWLQATKWRLMQRDPLSLEPFLLASAGSAVPARLTGLPARSGPRPRIAPHPVPHRQLTQLADEPMRQKLTELFDAKVRADRAHLAYRLSHFEKRNAAITLLCPACGHPDALASRGEVAHIHPSDGSMHMILGVADARAATEAGWAERHGLAGVTLSLPLTYMLVYAPRDDAELAVVGRLLDAAVAHMGQRERAG